MRPKHANVCNVTIPYIDSDDCDIDGNNDDTNNNNLLDKQQYTDEAKRSFVDGASIKMAIDPVNETLIAKQTSAINLTPQVLTDQADGCFGTTGESKHDCDKGVNVKFHDLVYRVRRGFSWDRCKFRSQLVF